MPKATKKKKEKEADFKKAKLKLGKGKKPASNATDTSFKARSIALPSQKPLARALVPGADDDGELDPSAVPTTAAGLTIDDVLVQLRHVNAGVRREAVGHMKEVLSAGVSMGVPLGERHGEVAKVVRDMGGLISDEDVGVRKALNEFMGWYLARLPRVSLSPYLPLLTLQVSSALSHIFPAIRIDTCRLVLLLLELHPRGIIGTWPARSAETNTLAGSSTVFDGLRLSAGLGEEKASGGYRLSAASKLIVLRTIRTFVEHALDDEKFETEKPVPPTYTLHDLSVLPADEQWSVNRYDWALDWQDTVHVEAGDDGAAAEIASTYTALHSLLLNTFLEAAPAAFSPSGASDETSLDLCVECAQLVRLFATALLALPDFASLPAASEVRGHFGEFLKRMAAWFPFESRAGASSSAGAKLFELSLDYARLATLLAPAPAPVVPKRDGWRARVRAIEAAWAGMKGNAKTEGALQRTAEWVEASLQPPEDALAPQIAAHEYSALLSIVWSLLLRPAAEDGEPILAFFLAATLKQPASGAKRRAGDALIIRLVNTHEDRFATEPLFVPLASPARPLLTQWIGSVPRTLWELGSRDSGATSALLTFLLRLSQRTFEKPYSLVDSAELPAVAAKLAPFFHLQHATRGAVDGPWCRLQEKEQRLALDVAKSWSGLDTDGRLGAAVTRAVHSPSAPAWAKPYWTRL